MESLPPHLAGKRAALVVGHPGHELRVHAWIERARPCVSVLTDGSGHDGWSRLASTAGLLARAGVPRGIFFGRLSDRTAYEMILRHAADDAAALVEELAASLVGDEVDYVVADAFEGFNPVHDLCRVLVDVAVEVARRQGRPLASFGFPLEAPPGTAPPGLGPAAIVVDLDEAEWQRKLAAAGAYPEMAAEVERAMRLNGAAAFRREILYEVAEGQPFERLLANAPFYETHGERQVAAGHYREVLRFREHFLPLAEEVRARALDT